MMYCGKSATRQEQDDMWSTLVFRAKQGNQEALTALYEESYGKVFFTIKSMIRDENAALDILQDSYIKAFTHLNDFDGGSKFLPWMRQIAANTARDYLRKKKPTLFTELTTDSDPDMPIEERFVDSNSGHMPDVVLDQAETTRLLREIIDSLPEDQRAVIDMYYYQELSVKDIAAALDISESAIKSRLLYARRKIERKVQELEKNGTKLYGLAPIPFLLWLLQGQEAQAAQLPNEQILQNLLKQSGQPAATSGAASSSATVEGASAATAAGAKVIGGLGSVKLGLIILASVAVIGAGAFGISHLRTQADAVNGPSESTSSPEAEPANSSETMKDAALACYNEIICNAPDYTYIHSDTIPTGYYRYSICSTSISEQIPMLLLGQEGDNGNYYVRIFQYDPETDSVIQPERIFEEGSDGSGYHAGLSRTTDGVILFTETYGASGDTEISSLTLVGEEIKLESQWSGRFNAIPQSLNRSEINWNEISFHGSEYGRIPPENEAPTTREEPPVESEPSVPPTDGDRIVFTGTSDTYSYEQVIELQGCPDPNAPWTDSSQTFHLIVLDAPQEMELQSGDPAGSPRSGTVRLILVAYAEGLDQYDGQHLTFSIDPNNTYWPSDTSMPVGQPGTTDVHILD